MNRQRDYYDDDYLVDAEYEPMRKRSPRGRGDGHAPPPPVARSSKPAAVQHYKKLFFVAFLLIVVAFILQASASYTEAPDIEDYDDGDDWRKAVDTYDLVIRILEVTAGLLLSLGALLMTFAFIIGGFMDTDQPDALRVAMIVAAIVIIALFLATGVRFTVSLNT